MKTPLTLLAFRAIAFSLMMPHTAWAQSTLFSRNPKAITLSSPSNQQATTQGSSAKARQNTFGSSLLPMAKVKRKARKAPLSVLPFGRRIIFRGKNPESSPGRHPTLKPVTANPISAIPLGPDLVVTDFKLVGAAINQGSFWGYKIEVTITNRGSAAAPDCPFVIIVKKTAGPGAFSEGPCWDLDHNWKTGKSLAPLESVKIQSSAVIPQTWAVLKGTLQTRVNATQNPGHSGGAILPGGVYETNKNNNASVKVGFTNPFQN